MVPALTPVPFEYFNVPVILNLGGAKYLIITIPLPPSPLPCACPSPPPPPPSEQQTDVEEDSAVAGQQDTKIKKQQQKKRSKDMARKGFFGTLFDLSFTEFITPRVVKFFYVLKIIALVLAWIGGLVFMFFMAPPEVVPGNIKIVILVVSPLVFLLSLIGVRMWFELAIVFFRVEENTRQ